jgi:alpha-D-ribose 1-methylphosphonate 5-triphosphate diphosphatase
VIADGLIVDAKIGRALNLSGYRVLPGIVDVHGDERAFGPP